MTPTFTDISRPFPTYPDQSRPIPTYPDLSRRSVFETWGRCRVKTELKIIKLSLYLTFKQLTINRTHGNPIWLIYISEEFESWVFIWLLNNCSNNSYPRTSHQIDFHLQFSTWNYWWGTLYRSSHGLMGEWGASRENHRGHPNFWSDF